MKQTTQIITMLDTLTWHDYLAHVCVPACWFKTIVLLDRGQKWKFQKIRDRGGGVKTSTQTTERTEMEKWR